MGYEKTPEIWQGYKIFGKMLNFPSSPLPEIINDRSLNMCHEDR